MACLVVWGLGALARLVGCGLGGSACLVGCGLRAVAQLVGCGLGGLARLVCCGLRGLAPSGLWSWGCDASCGLECKGYWECSGLGCEVSNIS